MSNAKIYHKYIFFKFLNSYYVLFRRHKRDCRLSAAQTGAAIESTDLWDEMLNTWCLNEDRNSLQDRLAKIWCRHLVYRGWHSCTQMACISHDAKFTAPAVHVRLIRQSARTSYASMPLVRWPLLQPPMANRIALGRLWCGCLCFSWSPPPFESTLCCSPPAYWRSQLSQVDVSSRPVGRTRRIQIKDLNWDKIWIELQWLRSSFVETLPSCIQSVV